MHSPELHIWQTRQIRNLTLHRHWGRGREPQWQKVFGPSSNFCMHCNEMPTQYVHCGASTQSWYFVEHFWHVPPDIGLILQLLCSQIGNRKFRKETKQNITTEWIPHSVIVAKFRKEERRERREVSELIARHCIGVNVRSPHSSGKTRATSNSPSVNFVVCGIHACYLPGKNAKSLFGTPYLSFQIRVQFKIPYKANLYSA